MTTIINRIVALAGPLPDEVVYRRYLAGLTPEALLRKSLELAEDAAKPPTRNARGWRSPRMWGRKNRPLATTLS